MCGTETGKRVKDKTVTGPTMGLTCNKGEPKVRPSLSFYRCTAYFAAGMKGPIIIHICKKKDFLCYPRLSHPLVLLFSNNILTCLSFIFFQIRFLIKIDKKLERDMAEETHVLLKIRTIKSSGGPRTEGRGKSPTRLHAGPKEIWTVPGF